jgi:uncharacterized protein YecE (DUF72 family)
MVQGWAERTPPGFTMHVKAFGLMTRHPVKIEVLPEDLRAAMPVDERGRVDRPPRELRGEVFRRFLAALEPLRREGKLGGILFQLPSYVVFKDASFEYLEWARAQLGGDAMLVEFRHRSTKTTAPSRCRSSSGSAPRTSPSTRRAPTRRRTSCRRFRR